jgi:hypothetical protein
VACKTTRNAGCVGLLRGVTGYVALAANGLAFCGCDSASTRIACGIFCQDLPWSFPGGTEASGKAVRIRTGWGGKKEDVGVKGLASGTWLGSHKPCVRVCRKGMGGPWAAPGQPGLSPRVPGCPARVPGSRLSSIYYYGMEPAPLSRGYPLSGSPAFAGYLSFRIALFSCRIPGFQDGHAFLDDCLSPGRGPRSACRKGSTFFWGGSRTGPLTLYYYLAFFRALHSGRAGFGMARGQGPQAFVEGAIQKVRVFW